MAKKISKRCGNCKWFLIDPPPKTLPRFFMGKCLCPLPDSVTNFEKRKMKTGDGRMCGSFCSVVKNLSRASE